MARQNINIGTIANDGSGDTLRTAGQKINETFVELFQALGGDSDTLNITVSFVDSGLSFEGSVDDGFETFLGVVNPTSDQVILLPDSSGTLSFKDTPETLTNKIIQTPDIIQPDILESADAPFKLILVPDGTLVKNTNLHIPSLSDSDTIVTNTSTSTLTNKTLTDPFLTDPQIDSAILDGNGATIVALPAGASAINHIEIANAANGSAPSVSAVGGDANIDLKLASKGAGRVLIDTPLAINHGNDYNVNGAISTNASVALINGTSGAALSMTLADGTNNQFLHILNINTGTATITPTTFAQGTSFDLRGGHGATCVYNTVSSVGSTAGWYILGLDSDGGLGNTVIVS